MVPLFIYLFLNYLFLDDNDEGASKWLPVGEKSDSLTCFNTVVNHSVVASHLLNLLREKYVSLSHNH